MQEERPTKAVQIPRDYCLGCHIHRKQAGPQGKGQWSATSFRVHSSPSLLVLLALRPQYPPPLLSSDLNSYFFLQSHILCLLINMHIVGNCPIGLCSSSGELCFSVQNRGFDWLLPGDGLRGMLCSLELKVGRCNHSPAQGTQWATVINGHVGWVGLHRRSHNPSKTSS